MEYIDIYDENNNTKIGVKEKEQAHKDGNFHRTAHIWIINDKNELLIQKRSASKKNYPNYWDVSGAGHIRTGESEIQGAIRELNEELGLEVNDTDLHYIATVKIDGSNDKEFQYVYLLKCNKKVDEYIFKDGEVSEVKYVPYEEFEKMAKEKVKGLVKHEAEYKYLFNYIRSSKILKEENK